MPPDSRRIAHIDALRTLALIAMAVFHFGVDLEMFGLAPPGMTTQGGWWWAARIIAASFLFLAGVSQFLAHGEAFRPKAFWRRLAIVVAAALAVSVATRVAMPTRFIYFGILHSIAAASLVGLLFLRLPPWVTLGAAALVFCIGNGVSHPAFDHPLLWWTGLAPPFHARPSLDFEPLLPWLAAFLAGQGLAALGARLGLWQRLRGTGGPALWRLGWPGRHSLAIYLLHQPILMGGFMGARALGLI